MCIELLGQKLADFGLNLRKDIVGIMIDGASVGRLLPVNQQLSFDHGLQLAIIKVLYQKQGIKKQIDQQDEQSQKEHDFSESNLARRWIFLRAKTRLILKLVTGIKVTNVMFLK